MIGNAKFWVALYAIWLVGLFVVTSPSCAWDRNQRDLYIYAPLIAPLAFIGALTLLAGLLRRLGR